MIITCNKCDTSYELDKSLIKETGSKVRCTNCGNVFLAELPKPIKAKDPEPVLEMESGVEEEEISHQPTTETALDDSDSLDLSDIEKMLESEDLGDSENDFETAADEPELQLELEIPTEGDESSQVPADKDDDPDSLDLSDIEKMLELEDLGDSENDFETAADEPELQLELEMPTGNDEISQVPAEKADDPDSLDLSDIEKMLESEAPGDTENGIETTTDEPEFELEIEMPPENDNDKVATDNESLELESDDDFELELEEPDDITLESHTTTDKMEPVSSDASQKTDLDFNFEDEKSVAEPVIDVSEDETREAEEKVFEMGSEYIENEPEEVEEIYAAPVYGPKKKRRGPIIFLLVFLILAGGTFGAYVYLNQEGIKLPFLGVTAGEIVAIEESLEYIFVENTKLGTLFVITGNVENKYDHDRSHISVTGEILAEDGKVVKTQTVYCGNVFNEQELSNADMVKIKQFLGKQTGSDSSNVHVRPGDRLPFMVVFSDLPDNIKEYRLKVAGSVKAEN